MRYLAFALVLPLALTCACQSGGGGGGAGSIASDGFPAPSQDAVWEASVRVLREQGYVPDFTNSARPTSITTRWRNALSPFSRDGFREKATVRVVPIAGQGPYFRTETNVQRQQNNDVYDPGNAMAAEWGDTSRNASTENLINRRIEMFFLPGEVSPTFRRQNNMPAVDSPRRIETPTTTPQGTPYGLPDPYDMGGANLPGHR